MVGLFNECIHFFFCWCVIQIQEQLYMIQQNKHKETVTTTVTTAFTVTVKGIPWVYQLFSLQFNQNLKGGEVGGEGEWLFKEQRISEGEGLGPFSVIRLFYFNFYNIYILVLCLNPSKTQS